MDNELKEIIAEDKEYYFGESAVKRVYRIITHNPLYQRGKYIICARKCGYYSKNCASVTGKLLYIYYMRRKNVLGEKLHIELGPDSFGRRLRIYHNDIVVNIGAVIGDDCELYGNNCIGNKGSEAGALDAPVVGNHVSFGVGACAIGGIRISDNVKISSKSLVNRDICEAGTLYGGIPARKLR